MASAEPGFHPPVEEYLEAIHALDEEGTKVIQARLADRLGHSAPSVSEMVRRLRADGYVAGDGRSIELTRQGRNLAESVVRKHRLAELLLTEIIGLDWHKAHIEAGRWEHVISDEVEQRLIEILGHPSACPHGNPIPGADTEPPPSTPLAACQVGDRIVLRRVTEEVEVDAPSLIYLSDHGFLPGSTAEVTARAPDGTLTLELAEGPLALGTTLAARLFVSEAEPVGA